MCEELLNDDSDMLCVQLSLKNHIFNLRVKLEGCRLSEGDRCIIVELLLISFFQLSNAEQFLCYALHGVHRSERLHREKKFWLFCIEEKWTLKKNPSYLENLSLLPLSKCPTWVNKYSVMKTRVNWCSVLEDQKFHSIFIFICKVLGSKQWKESTIWY